MRPVQLFATVLAVSSLSSAWWDEGLLAGKPLDKFEGMLYGRQDRTTAEASSTDAASRTDSASASGSATASASDSASASASDSAAATTDGTRSGSASESASGSGTGKATGTEGTGTGKASKTGTEESKSSTFDARNPAGGISMVTPAATTTTFMKIGDWFTFAWNYTSLSVTPKKIDVLASCSAKETAYEIAMNLTVEPTQKVLWDTNPISDELVMETYTLLVYDAEKAVTQTAPAGYFGPQTTYTFAVYSGQSYTPRDQWQCIACNPGNKLSADERQTLFFLFSMATITVLSFTWFASGVFGVF